MTSNRGRRGRVGWLGVVALVAMSGCGNDKNGGAANGGKTGSSGVSGSTGASGGAVCNETVDSVVISNGAAVVPQIAAIEGGFALTWLEKGEVIAASADQNGAVSHRTQVSAAAGKAALPSIMPVSGGYMVLWHEGSVVKGRTLSAAFAPGAPPFVVAQTTSAEPRPAAIPSGNSVLATWMSQPSLVAALVSQTGGVAQRGTATGWFPAIASDGARTAIAWSQGGKQGPVHVALIDSMGGGVDIAGSASLIKSLVFAGGIAFVAWEDVTSGTEAIKLAKVDLDKGSVVGSIDVSPGSGSANWPTLAWNGSGLAVAYYQFRDKGSDLFLQVFDGNLQPVSGEMTLETNAKYPRAVWSSAQRIAVVYNKAEGPAELSALDCP